jgi:hypothetical protein
MDSHGVGSLRDASVILKKRQGTPNQQTMNKNELKFTIYIGLEPTKERVTTE